MTTTEAAAELDVTRGQISRLIREGKLVALKRRRLHHDMRGWKTMRTFWDIDGRSVRKLLRSRRGR